MTSTDQYQPRAEDRFSFGLWTVGNRGRDPFGDFVRPVILPIEIVSMLAEVGAWGVNLHDNDLVPIDAKADDAAALDLEMVRVDIVHRIILKKVTKSHASSSPRSWPILGL